MIIAAQMLPGDRHSRYKGGLQGAILHFVLVSARSGEVWKKIAGLRVYAGAIKLVAVDKEKVTKFGGGNGRRAGLRAERGRIGRVKTLHRICYEFVIVGFRAGNLVVPMLAAGKIPASIRAEKTIVGVFVKIWRQQQRLARGLCAAAILAQR